MPEVGDYFTVRSSGFVPWAIRKVTRSPVNHAGVYVGRGEVVEAQPGGAKLTPVEAYASAYWSSIRLTGSQRLSVALNALDMLGTPYNFLDIFALFMAKVFGKTTPPFIRRRLQREDRLICSQLVDLAYVKAGVHLFTDGRPAEDVTPGDLYEVRNG